MKTNFNKIITEAKIAESAIKIAKKEFGIKIDVINNIYNKTVDAFWKKERKLDRQKHESLEKISTKKESLSKKKDTVISKLYLKVGQLKKIFELIDVSKDTDRILKVSIPKNSEGEISPVDILVSNTYIHLGVYIRETRKPKNKFSLIISGDSMFCYREKLIKYPYSYGNNLQNEGRIFIFLKEAATKDELLTWFHKQDKSTLFDLTEHNTLVKKYEEVVANCNTKKWKLLYLQNQKNYYENHYSRGTETEEYKKVLSDIDKLKKAE